MKKRHPAINALTAILAVLLSVVLILLLPVTAVYGIVLNTITPQSISQIVQTSVTDFVESPDFEQMILDNDAVQSNIEELGITTEAVSQLMQSEAAGKVIDLLSADFSNALNGSDEVNLTPEALLTIVKEHADELADIAVEMADEPLDKTKIRQQIIDTVERDAEQFTAIMPDVESLRNDITDDGTAARILALLNTAYLWAAYGVCLVVALLIYACRYYRFGGFLWLGVDSLLVGGLLGGISMGMTRVAVTLLPADMGNLKGIVLSVMDRVSHSFLIQALIHVGVAVLLIGGYILLYTLVIKKKMANTGTSVAVTAEAADNTAPMA